MSTPDLRRIAERVLRLEAEAILALVPKLDEGFAREMPEETMADAILFAHKQIVTIVDLIEELRIKAGLGKKDPPPAGTPNPLLLGPTGTPPITIDGGNFKFYAATAGKNTVMNLYDLTDNYVSTGTAGANIGSATPVNVILGGNSITAGGNDRKTDTAFYAMYNSILTKPQIDQIYAAVKDLLLLRPGTPIIV